MLRDTFCSSPWFHMRINNSGHYEYCRWAVKQDQDQPSNITETTPVEFFQQGMSQIRKDLLNGETLPGCADCHAMEQHNKVSGRQKQLLKTGIRIDHFEDSLLSSPWLIEYAIPDNFKQTPQDWQIDLGNYCNSACIFCDPGSSSRLASEFKRIGIVDAVPPRAWCDDPVLLDKFLDSLRASKNIKYLHFIGGETLITPAFRKILQMLIAENMHSEISIGFTTNLTLWDQDIVDLLVQFKEVHLGMSIECVDRLNDYVRFGGNIDYTLELVQRWLTVARAHDWYTQLRITPTVFTIWHLVTVYQFAAQHSIAVESCNFLNNPAFLRPSVLPQDMRQIVIKHLEDWLTLNQVDSAAEQIVNIRSPSVVQQQIAQDAASYVGYLKHQPDESHRLPDLVAYITKLENSRNNYILDYLPEYGNILKAAGYNNTR